MADGPSCRCGCRRSSPTSRTRPWSARWKASDVSPRPEVPRASSGPRPARTRSSRSRARTPTRVRTRSRRPRGTRARRRRGRASSGVAASPDPTGPGALGVGDGVAVGSGVAGAAVTRTVPSAGRSGTGPAMNRSTLATTRSNRCPAPSASVEIAKIPAAAPARTASKATRRTERRRCGDRGTWTGQSRCGSDSRHDARGRVLQLTEAWPRLATQPAIECETGPSPTQPTGEVPIMRRLLPLAGLLGILLLPAPAFAGTCPALAEGLVDKDRIASAS